MKKRILKVTNAEILSRRNFIKKSAICTSGLLASSEVRNGFINSQEKKSKYPLRVSVRSAALNLKGKIEAIEAAYKAGADGIEVDFYSDLKNPDSLRIKTVQIAYRDAALQYGIQISSLSLGAKLKSEPNSIVWVMEAIECARNLGAKVILISTHHSAKPETEEEFDRLIASLKELAPHANKEGIVLALECELSAKDQLRIINEVNQPSVKLYYDCYNAMHYGYEPLKEIPLLGDAIGQFHVKNGRNRLRVRIEGMKHPNIPGQKIKGYNHPAIAAQIRKIGYKGWLTLESPVLSNDSIADVRDNISYTREVYDIF